MPADRAWELVVRACWHGEVVADASDDDLAAALRFAARNEVDAPFVRAYGERLPAELARLERAVAAYRANLAEACGRLTDAGVCPILIKALPDEDFTYSNFDVVVGDDGWDAAVEALEGWVVSTSRYPLERGTKLLLYPAAGPAVHLHREVAWFDVPAIPTERLRSEAVPAAPVACFSPSPTDTLDILLAHAVFQNLALSLGELLTYRRLAASGVEPEAARRAEIDGWGRGFRGATRAARETIRHLGRLEPTPLLVPLPIAASVVGGAEHAAHLARTGRLAGAARELVLRGPLVAAKRRALRR